MDEPEKLFTTLLDPEIPIPPLRREYESFGTVFRDLLAHPNERNGAPQLITGLDSNHLVEEVISI